MAIKHRAIARAGRPRPYENQTLHSKQGRADPAPTKNSKLLYIF